TRTIIRMYYVFFLSSRRRHTRSKRDWSSDVYSSDLLSNQGRTPRLSCAHYTSARNPVHPANLPNLNMFGRKSCQMCIAGLIGGEIGRASCRERVYMRRGDVEVIEIA